MLRAENFKIEHISKLRENSNCGNLPDVAVKDTKKIINRY